MTDSRDAAFTDMVAEGKAVRQDTAALKMAKRIIDEQQALIDQLTSPRVKLGKAKKVSRPAGSFLRVVVSDIHGSQRDQEAFGAFVADMETLHPHETVINGDLIDCAGFLNEHQVMGFVGETDYTYADDIAVGGQILDVIAKHTQNDIYYAFGNHDSRPERWCITLAGRGRSDRKFVLQGLMQSFSVESLLQLDKRGVTYVKQSGFTKNTFTPGSFRLGESLYMHNGFFVGTPPPARYLARFGTNVAYGHDHQARSKITKVGGTGQIIIARSHGCLSQLQPLWNHTTPTEWSHGYGLELVRPDGTFLSLHVPIVNGESLLADLAGNLL